MTRFLQRLFLLGLVVVAILAGVPYAAVIMNNLMGTYTVIMTDRDGTQRSLILGPGAAIPDWMPDLPGGLLIQAGRWLPRPEAPDGGSLEVLTHRSLDTITTYYREAFERGGFTVETLGTGTLNPATAAWLGLDQQLAATRADRGLEVTVQVRSPDGLILRPRTVQIQWRQSAHPGTAPAPANRPQ